MEDEVTKELVLDKPVKVSWSQNTVDYTKLVFTRYADGKTLAVILSENPKTGWDYIDISIAIPEANLGPGEFCLNHNLMPEVKKEIEDNLDLYENTGRTVPSGFLDFPIMKLKEKYMKYI